MAISIGAWPSRAKAAHARGLGLGSARKLAVPIMPPAHGQAISDACSLQQQQQ